jgi:hypothetical protein
LTGASSLVWCPVWCVSLFCCMKVLDLCRVRNWAVCPHI